MNGITVQHVNPIIGGINDAPNWVSHTGVGKFFGISGFHGAMTFGSSVYDFRTKRFDNAGGFDQIKHDDISLLSHEITHTKQWEDAGGGFRF